MAGPSRKPLRTRTPGKLGAERSRAGVGSGQSTGIHSLDPEEGELFEYDPEDISPNPMNKRLELRDMDDLVASVQRQGIHTPGAAMHMRLFVEMYPQWAERIPFPQRTYILGPGHRRLEAARRAAKPMLVILRDTWAKELRVEENLISENNERDGLSPIEQALQLDLLRERGLTNDEIAERSGYGGKGTVSRFLALLTLPQELQDQVHQGRLSHRAAYVLSTVKDRGEPDSREAAHGLQLQAFKWMVEEGLSAEAAKNRLTIDAEFHAGNLDGSSPETSKSRRRTGKARAEVSRGKPPALPAVDTTGSESAIPKQTSGTPGEPSGTVAPESERQVAPSEHAAAARDLACRLLLGEERFAAAAEVTGRLVYAVLHPAEWEAAAALACQWLGDGDQGAVSPDHFVSGVAESGDTNLMRRVAFAIALAADELHASRQDQNWTPRDGAYIRFLMTSKAAYQPTGWEREQLDHLAGAAR